MANSSNGSSRHIYTIIGVAGGLLLVLSALPWSRLTGNMLKDFNLFGDLFPDVATMPVATGASTISVDPELDALLADNNTQNSTAPASADTTDTDSSQIAVETPVTEAHVQPAALLADGSVAIECYTGNSRPLERFRAALADASQRVVRVAVIGDSYIEGDIFCKDLRALLQERFGGTGVGFMASHSDFPGFRGTVSQSSTGWKMHDIRTMKRRDSIRTLSSDYGVCTANAKSTFSGTKNNAGTKQWHRTRFAFIAPDSGTVTLTAADGTSNRIEAAPSPRVQWAELIATTGKVSIETDIAGLVSLGTYLDGTTGVQVDCMSVRGNSGLATARMNIDLCRQMAAKADYDLIILEFGMNVLSAEQTDYTPYMLAMTKGIERIRKCYPKADIIVMGVGDRGIKSGAEVTSLPTVTAMVNAQRETARRTGTHFWDTRSAMGGPGSIVQWRKNKHVNADYIHLNHAGGRQLAELFDKSLSHALDE